MLKPFLNTIISLFILAWFLPNVSYQNWLTLALFAITLTLINLILRPLLKLLTLPINIITLGLFSGLINVALLWLALYLVPGFTISPMTLFGIQLGSFLTLVVMSFLISLTQSLIGIFV